MAPLELHVRDLGGEGLPPLVVLHGLLGSSRNWQTAGAALAERHHVLALDLRNHGASPHDDEAGYAAMLADLEAWFGARGLAAAAVLGHSLGGKLAMLLACRRPALVGRLVVVDIAPKAYAWPERRKEFEALNGLDLAALASRAQAERLIEPLVPDWGMRKFLLTNLERGPEGWRWAANLPALTRGLGELERNPLEAGDRFDGPALFLAGGRSRYVPPGDEALIRGHFPAARVEWIEGAGHNPHLEARDDLVLRVAAFTAGPTAAAS